MCKYYMYVIRWDIFSFSTPPPSSPPSLFAIWLCMPHWCYMVIPMEQMFSPFGTSYKTLPDIQVIIASDITFCTPLRNHVLYFPPWKLTVTSAVVEKNTVLSLVFFLSSFFSPFFLSHLSLGNGLQQHACIVRERRVRDPKVIRTCTRTDNAVNVKNVLRCVVRRQCEKPHVSK